MAITAAHHRGLQRVTVEDMTAVIGLLLDRRWQLVSQRQRTIVQLHATLTELTPAGARSHLTTDKAAALLRSLRPATAVQVERKQVCSQMLSDWRWLNRRIPPAEDRLADAVTASGTTLTDVHGIAIVGAATILARAGDVTRFPTAGHFAAFNGTAPIEASSGDVIRHRLSRRGDRQLNKVIHVAARCQAATTPPDAPTTSARSTKATANSGRSASSSGRSPTPSTGGSSPTRRGGSGADRSETKPKSA